MFGKGWVFITFAGIVAAGLGSQCAQAGDIKITIPKRSALTPVQRMNRDGVEAIRKHDYAKAEKLFYRAYLFDTEDAFTLNNLGYISELQGQVDRAQRFYSLAAEQLSDAVIDRASARRVEGRPMKVALALSNQPLQMHHSNVAAVRLLAQGRAPEADLLLQEALKTDPHNVFTLNNMGVTKEMEGEAREALKCFDGAAKENSAATAVVTVDRIWRGRPINELAAQNAKTLRDHMARGNDLAEQVAELNLRGVSALNRNDVNSADGDFRKAYALDPNDAFTLNNIGYIAELEGDRETAQFFYDRARLAQGANAIVGVASRRTEEGRRLLAVAADSNIRVERKVTQDRDELRRQHEPVVLRRRDNSIVDEPAQPPLPAPIGQTPQQQ